jgi:hypothetical protein
VAMISTQSGVWLRPAILGGFGGTSDRSFLFICVLLAMQEVAGEEFSSCALFYHVNTPVWRRLVPPTAGGLSGREMQRHNQFMNLPTVKTSSRTHISHSLHSHDSTQ